MRTRSRPQIGWLLLVVAAPLSAATLRVPQDFSTIQAAVDAAANGDEIAVAPGEYRGQTDIINKAITLRSTQGASVTTIAGSGDTDVAALVIRDVTTGTVTIRGFTVTGAVLMAGPRSAALVNNAPVHLLENRFSLNSGSGVLSLSNSVAVVERNIFERNFCSGSSAVLRVSFGSNARIVNNVFYRGTLCAGVDLSGASTQARLFNNTFIDIEQAIRFSSTYPTGIVIRNNAIARLGALGAEALIGTTSGVPVNAIWENNLTFGFTQPFVNFPDPTGTNGNISANPGLSAYATGDYRPDSGSPLIDAGNNSVVEAGALDYFGQIRIGAPTHVVDIGAVEYYAGAPIVNLQVSRTDARLGNTVDLTWQAVGADSCTASGEWSGARALTGTESFLFTQPGPHQFTLTCRAGTVEHAQQRVVNVYFPPTIQFDPNQTIFLGDTAHFGWLAREAQRCEATGGAWNGEQALFAGTNVTPTTTGTHEYRLTCSGLGGEVTATYVVVVNPAPQVQVTLTPSTITTGQSATLSWTSQGVSSCVRNDSSNPVANSGQLTITPDAAGTMLLRIECLTASTSTPRVEDSETLTVQAAGPTPTPPKKRGGAMSELSLLTLATLALVVIRRRLRNLSPVPR